jgi:hypothetical protein
MIIFIIALNIQVTIPFNSDILFFIYVFFKFIPHLIAMKK